MTKTVGSDTAADHANAKSTKDLNPNKEFVNASLNMGWQLAIVVLIPIVGGYKLDTHFKSSPLWTIVGFVIAMLGTFFIIKRTFNEFNQKIYIKGKK